MSSLLDNAGFVALMGTIFGGAGLKITEAWLGRAKDRANEDKSMREELRKEIDNLRTQLEKADAEEKRLEGLIDEWKEKYWEIREEKQTVVTELTITLDRLKNLEKQLGLDTDDPK